MEVFVSLDLSPLVLRDLTDEAITRVPFTRRPIDGNPFDQPPPEELVAKWLVHIEAKRRKFGKVTDFETLWFEQGGRCTYCESYVWAYNVPLAEGHRSGTVDHVTARVRGGRNELSNKACACRRCNNMKSDLSEDEFRERIAKRR